jgi:hypothetical protein
MFAVAMGLDLACAMPRSGAEKWTLKKVQGDEERDSQQVLAGFACRASNRDIKMIS